MDILSKYRPKTFEDVIGQERVVASLQRACASKTRRAFLFTGPSGTGKTTLARIVAASFGVEPRDILEVDAATNTGVDEMRKVTTQAAYRGLSGKGRRAIILDEAHALSKAAWQASLKSIEEPPAHVVWLLCTTEADKVPETVRTRCLRYDLGAVETPVLEKLLKRVNKAESLGASDAVVELVARKSGGSPRRALTALLACAGVTDAQDALGLLREVDEKSDDVINLCRALLKGTQWPDVCGLLKPMREKNAESVRIVLVNYMASVALNPRDAGTTSRALAVIDAFRTPIPQQGGFANLVLGCGRVHFGEE